MRAAYPPMKETQPHKISSRLTKETLKTTTKEDKRSTKGQKKPTKWTVRAIKVLTYILGQYFSYLTPLIMETSGQ